MRIFSNFWFRSFLVFEIVIGSTCECYEIAKFTNVQCFNLVETASEFTECRLRAIQRDVAELSIRAKLLKEAKSNLKIRWELMKKATGYRPFLYDVTVDVCEYFHKRNHPFVNIILNSFANHSTTLNKCPISGEIALSNFRFPVKSLELLPLPAGEYAIFSTFSENAMQMAIVKVYFILTEF